MLAAFSVKCNVTVWRPFVHPSVCPVFLLTRHILNVTHYAASVHFDPTIRKTDILLVTANNDHAILLENSHIKCVNCTNVDVFFAGGPTVFCCGRSLHSEAIRIRLFLWRNSLNCCVTDIAWRNHRTPHSKCTPYCTLIITMHRSNS